MRPETTIIYEYTEVLHGKKQSFTMAFDGTPLENKKTAGVIWRYAITKLLKWTLVDAQKYLNDDIVMALRLNKTFSALGILPKQTILDYNIILQYAFPDNPAARYDFKKETLTEYKYVAKEGEFEFNKEPHKYPKDFFIDDKGIKRAELIMRYLVDKYFMEYTNDERYSYFADRQQAMRWLKKRRMDAPCQLMYDGSPLDLFYFSQFLEDRDDVAYYNHKIHNELSERIKANLEMQEGA